jgi:hypothetical protein
MAVIAAGIAPASSAADANKLRVVSDQAVTGFAFPESVGCDLAAKVLYVSQFGGTELKPAEKDGKGRISKLSLDGKILEEQFLPAAGEILNKPKGIWIRGSRLWVTDIDVVWIFDLKTRKGRKLELPGIKFANDPAVRSNILYVSDNRADQLFRVEPADFLNAKSEPRVSVVLSGKSIQPNGLYPAKDGSLLMVGFVPKERHLCPLPTPCMLFIQAGSNVRDAGAEEHRLPFLPRSGGQTGGEFPRPALASIRDRTAMTVDDLQGNARGSSPPQRPLV